MSARGRYRMERDAKFQRAVQGRVGDIYITLIELKPQSSLASWNQRSRVSLVATTEPRFLSAQAFRKASRHELFRLRGILLSGGSEYRWEWLTDCCGRKASCLTAGTFCLGCSERVAELMGGLNADGSERSTFIEEFAPTDLSTKLRSLIPTSSDNVLEIELFVAHIATLVQELFESPHKKRLDK